MQDRNHERTPLNEYFMQNAEKVSLRSTCLRHHFGAILVRDKRILSTGYNENPSGLPHCFELPEGCIRDSLHIASGMNLEICTAVHAEANALLQCAYHGVSSKGSTLYVTGAPCPLCSRMLVNAGVKRVVYKENEYGDEGLKILKQASIECIPFPSNKKKNE
ncbi:MAG: cytidine/deoxycytidylate deaminase family protein [Candidatus Hodarchaeota archaeon]